MASLTGTKIKDTYVGLLKTSDNGGLGASAKLITDGLGNSSGVYLGTSGNVGIGTSSIASGFKMQINGALFVNGGKVSVGLDGTAAEPSLSMNDGDTGLFRPSANVMGFSTAGTERMRIDSSGNVGIGEQNPLAKIHSKVANDGAASNVVLLQNSGTLSGTESRLFFLQGGTITRGAYISGYNESSSGSPTSLIFATSAAFATPTERMRIDSSGTVKIGNSATVTPYSLSKFVIDTGTYAYMDLLSTIGAGINFGDAGGSQRGVIDYDHPNDYMRFITAGAERMRITSGGGVCINAQSSDSSSYFTVSHGTNVGISLINTGTGSVGKIYFKNDNGVVGQIYTSGSSTIYAISSDYRLKEDWQPMAGALTRIDALKPVNFAWKADGSRVDGFLAHELQEVIPEAVTGEKDAMRDEEYEVSPAIYEDVVHPAEEAVYETIEHPAIAEELDADGNIIVEAQEAWTEQVLVSEAKEEWTEKVLVSEAVMGTRSVPDYQGIDQSKIVPLLVAAIQELKAEVDALKGA